MTAILSTIVTAGATWGPAVYCAATIAHNLVGPSYQIKNCGRPSGDAAHIVPDLFTKVNTLRQRIFLYHNSNVPMASALGTHFGPAAVVFLNTDLIAALTNTDSIAAIDDSAIIRFMVKSEISHIYTNSKCIASTLALLASAISTYAIPYLKSCLPLWAAPLSVAVPACAAFMVYIMTMLHFERKANNFAICHATDEELIGMTKFLKAQIEFNKPLAQKYPLRFTPGGDIIGDGPRHPCPYLSVRLQWIKKEYLRREATQSKTAGEQSSSPKIDIETVTVLDPQQLQKMHTFYKSLYKKLYKIEVA